MLVEAALQGGASGAIIVDGIQNFQHAVAGLKQQVIVIRDQNVAGNPTPGGDIPSWDLTLNNVPIAYPDETPAVIEMQPGQKQLWRVKFVRRQHSRPPGSIRRPASESTDRGSRRRAHGLTEPFPARDHRQRDGHSDSDGGTRGIHGDCAAIDSHRCEPGYARNQYGTRRRQ
jgi:hypothetical protein